ncbi:SLATT domain-containing protein [Blastococcus haudaquaticus]|uniref:SLATT domain-containing protein n=1 Tax=Blastococcus haudaquaticus TaxID=1938745 RepID=UPI00135B647C|nr:SLATT domain-containing protein [Blastococcus haudaquaticus]
MELLELLEQRSYATYKARLRASKRLMTRNNAWNASLIATATSTTIASVALLANDGIYGPNGDTLFVCLAVLSLTASLVTSGLNYSGRSRDMFSNYRRIQRLSAEAERAKRTPSMQNFATVAELNAKYDELLDGSENHTEADYFHANGEGSKPASVRRESLLSFFPYISLIIPLLLLPPLLCWMF